MSTNAAVRRLHTDLTKMHQAAASEKKAQTSVKTDGNAEKKALAGLQSQEQAIVDSFNNLQAPPTQAQQMAALKQMFSLGEKQVQTQDRFDNKIAGDKKSITKDKALEKKDKKQALKDLKPAEYHLSLKDTNAARKQLGLKALSKPVRVDSSAKMQKAVNIAEQAVHMEQTRHNYDYTQAYGARTNYGRGPTGTGPNGRATFDCSGFVGAVYKAAGLPSPYTVGYEGTSFDVAACKNMQKVSQSQAKPGDVVVFPDHIALYIGGGNCISMGQEGDPKVVSVAAEAAYQNRGIQGFYHPKGN
jgi:cell wall-associated NlpC family hydrolase